MTILGENIEESKKIENIEDLKPVEKVVFGEIRRYLEWLRQPQYDKAALQDEVKVESRDLSNFYKKEHSFCVTLI